jgi:predicted phage tail protein
MAHKDRNLIIGAGGGGGGGKGGGRSGGGGGASVAPDNLDSTQVARILDLLSEGEIEGFPAARAYTWGTDQYNRAALKNVYFNNTPVLREEADVNNVQASDYNFDVSNAVFAIRKGTQDQSYTDIIGDANQQEHSVNVKVGKNVPVTRSITDTDVTSVRVTLSVPALQVFKNNGNVEGSSVTYQIQTSYSGGPYTTVVTDSITGRTADLYQRKQLITLTHAAPVNIRVVRVTDDAPASGTNGETVNNDLYWASYTEKINAKTTYPNSALFGLKINAEQFSSIPTRSYRIRGIKVAIPSNASVDPDNGRLIYSGVWNGTFQAAKWCSDPAWILWDLLVSKRYGLGDHVNANQLDKWSFYSCSQYASALVDDGLGGKEPRFSCNVNIQTQDEAFKLINSLASTMRVMPFWSAGSLTLSQDAPADFAYVFNQSNCTEAGFNYSGSSLKTRHTVVAVSYFDLDLRDKAWEVVEDKEGIDKFGVVKTEVEAFGCTSRGQARRLGEWIIYSEQNETETVTFTTDIAAGTTVRPGDIIKIADPARAGVVRSGRCSAGSTINRVVLDREITDITQGFTLNVMLPDGTLGIAHGSTSSGNIVTPGTALSQAPVAGAPYSLGDANVSLSLWRVLGVQEQDGATYAISALSYNSTKYDYIERGVPLQYRDVSDLNQPPSTPLNVQALEVLYESNGQVQQKIIVSWSPSSRTTQYELRYRLNNGNYASITTRAPDAEIINSDVGTYSIEVYAIGASGKRSSPGLLSFNAIGKTAPPQSIPDLFIAPIDDKSAELYWPQAVDIDVRIGGEIRIRHCPLSDNTASWGQSNDVVPAVPGSATRKIVPLLAGTYFIRAVDSLGNESADTASVVVSLPAPQDAFLIQQYEEETSSPPFAGTSSFMVYNTSEGGLTLTAQTLVDSMAPSGNWDGLGVIDYIGGSVSEGNYQFASTLDLGGVYDVDLLSVLKSRAFEPGNYWDDRIALVDDWDAVDGDDLGSVNASLYVRTTNNNPSSSPTWSDWQPFINNTSRGRGFQFKLVANASNPGQNLVVEQLGVITQFQRRTELQRNLTSGSSTYTVTFPTAFYDVPSIGITAQDLGTGGYFTVSNATRTGFQVTFRNGGGSIVSKVFDYQAVGHGRQIA